jgi:hypothetical protein
MKIWFLAVAVVLVSGCMTTGDVIETGPDTYMVTSLACPACGGKSKAIVMALQKASGYCAAQGKRFLRGGLENEKWINGAGETILEFRCLSENHPAFMRADGRRESDIIIENR